VVTTGTFDGVHLGHHTIIDRLNHVAHEVDGESVLLTFDPHPRTVLFPDDRTLRLINDRDEQIEQLRKAGVQHLIIHPFTAEFARLSAHEYVKQLLVEGIHVNRMVVGYDHHFGYRREGDFALLTQYADEFGFTVEEIPAHMIAAVNVSSTKIRNALTSGDILTANQYLGYNYPLSGVVMQGDGIGRLLGFPTANLLVRNPLKLIPADGVYAVHVHCLGGKFPGMLNIGVRPTVSGSGERRIEVHLVGRQGDFYGEAIHLEFVQRIRDEAKFANRDELMAQLHADRYAVIELLS
jgi:riboflavin kinase/FMN adenylyltransferase